MVMDFLKKRKKIAQLTPYAKNVLKKNPAAVQALKLKMGELKESEVSPEAIALNRITPYQELEQMARLSAERAAREVEPARLSAERAARELEETQAKYKPKTPEEAIQSPVRQELTRLLEQNPEVGLGTFGVDLSAPDDMLKRVLSLFKQYLASDEETRRRGPHGYGWRVIGGLGPPRLKQP